MTRDRPRALPWLLAFAGGGLWAVAHVIALRQRGWPRMDVRGEWDVLLTTLALAAGDPPDAVLGAVHGYELGSYLIAALVSLPVTLGADPVVAAKLVALGFGALLAGATVWLATWLALRASPDAEPLRVAVAVGPTILVVACAWPGLHLEFAGLSGNTLESFALQVVAVGLTISRSPGASLRPLAVGALLTAAVLLSPVAAWTGLGLAAAALLVRPRPRPRALALAVAGGALVVAAFAAFVPGGGEGLARFLVEQVDGQGLGGPDTGAPLGLGILAHIHHALEGRALNPALGLRPVALAGLGWILVLGLLVAVRPGPPHLRAVAMLALSWAVPLMLLPAGRWFYPLAFRYWVLAIALALAVLPAVLLRLGRPGRLGAGALACLALACVPSLPALTTGPFLLRAEAIMGAAAHTLEPRPGRDRHAAFHAFAPHLPSRDRGAFAEGYGLRLGGDEAQRRPGAPPIDWSEVADRLEPGVRARFLVGVGCGMTVRGPVTDRMVEVIHTAPAAHRDAVFWGLGRCTEPSERPELLSEPAFVAGRARAPFDGIRSSVPAPQDQMSLRW